MMMMVVMMMVMTTKLISFKRVPLPPPFPIPDIMTFFSFTSYSFAFMTLLLF